MLIRCPTCGGSGRVPDAKHSGPMFYYSPETGESWPHVVCLSCGGNGWVEYNTGKTRLPADDKPR